MIAQLTTETHGIICGRSADLAAIREYGLGARFYASDNGEFPGYAGAIVRWVTIPGNGFDVLDFVMAVAP